jgi:hypothetical protein
MSDPDSDAAVQTTATRFPNAATDGALFERSLTANAMRVGACVFAGAEGVEAC